MITQKKKKFLAELELKYKELDGFSKSELFNMLSKNGWVIKEMDIINNNSYYFDNAQKELFNRNESLRIRHWIEGDSEINYKRPLLGFVDKPFTPRVILREIIQNSQFAQDGLLDFVKSKNILTNKNISLSLTESTQYKYFILSRNSNNYTVFFSDKTYTNSRNEKTSTKGFEFERKGYIPIKEDCNNLDEFHSYLKQLPIVISKKGSYEEGCILLGC